MEWPRLRIMLIILQLVIFAYDIYNYHAIFDSTKDKSKICQKTDSLLTLIFYMFVVVVVGFYLSRTYKYLAHLYNHAKKKSEARKGLLGGFDEDKLRMI